MKKIYMKPATEIVSGSTEKPIMLVISGTTTPEETESKGHGFSGWDDDEATSENTPHGTNAWDSWEE